MGRMVSSPPKLNRKKAKNGVSTDSPIFVAEVAPLIDEEEGMDEYGRWWNEVSGRREHGAEVRRFIENHITTRLPKDGGVNKGWEKLTFVFTVAHVAFLSAATTAPRFMPFIVMWYTVVSPLLIAFRYFQYRPREDHYFLLDFCYWAWAAMLAYLWGLNWSPEAFLVMFSLAHGPMAWTIPVYRNSLVFHSLDRFTSCFIHLAPALVLYVIRWFPSEAAEFLPFEYTPIHPEWDITNENTNSSNLDINTPLLWSAAGATLAYMAWQALYAFLIGFVSKKFGSCMSVYHDKSKTTLYRYTAESGKGWVFNLIMCLGPKHSWAVWIVINATYTALVCLPTYLLYVSFIANSAFLVFIFLFAVYNGANFYMEAFAKIQWKRAAKQKERKELANMRNGAVLVSTSDEETGSVPHGDTPDQPDLEQPFTVTLSSPVSCGVPGMKRTVIEVDN